MDDIGDTTYVDAPNTSLMLYEAPSPQRPDSNMQPHNHNLSRIFNLCRPPPRQCKSVIPQISRNHPVDLLDDMDGGTDFIEPHYHLAPAKYTPFNTRKFLPRRSTNPTFALQIDNAQHLLPSQIQDLEIYHMRDESSPIPWDQSQQYRDHPHGSQTPTKHSRSGKDSFSRSPAHTASFEANQDTQVSARTRSRLKQKQQLEHKKGSNQFLRHQRSDHGDVKANDDDDYDVLQESHRRRRSRRQSTMHASAPSSASHGNEQSHTQERDETSSSSIVSLTANHHTNPQHHSRSGSVHDPSLSCSSGHSSGMSDHTCYQYIPLLSKPIDVMIQEINQQQLHDPYPIQSSQVPGSSTFLTPEGDIVDTYSMQCVLTTETDEIDYFDHQENRFVNRSDVYLLTPNLKELLHQYHLYLQQLHVDQSNRYHRYLTEYHRDFVQRRQQLVEHYRDTRRAIASEDDDDVMSLESITPYSIIDNKQQYYHQHQQQQQYQYYVQQQQQQEQQQLQQEQQVYHQQLDYHQTQRVQQTRAQAHGAKQYTQAAPHQQQQVHVNQQMDYQLFQSQQLHGHNVPTPTAAAVAAALANNSNNLKTTTLNPPTGGAFQFKQYQFDKVLAPGNVQPTNFANPPYLAQHKKQSGVPWNHTKTYGPQFQFQPQLPLQQTQTHDYLQMSSLQFGGTLHGLNHQQQQQQHGGLPTAFEHNHNSSGQKRKHDSSAVAYNIQPPQTPLAQNKTYFAQQQQQQQQPTVNNGRAHAISAFYPQQNTNNPRQSTMVHAMTPDRHSPNSGNAAQEMSDGDQPPRFMGVSTPRAANFSPRGAKMLSSKPLIPQLAIQTTQNTSTPVNLHINVNATHQSQHQPFPSSRALPGLSPTVQQQGSPNVLSQAAIPPLPNINQLNSFTSPQFQTFLQDSTQPKSSHHITHFPPNQQPQKSQLQSASNLMSLLPQSLHFGNGQPMPTPVKTQSRLAAIGTPAHGTKHLVMPTVVGSPQETKPSIFVNGTNANPPSSLGNPLVSPLLSMQITTTGQQPTLNISHSQAHPSQEKQHASCLLSSRMLGSPAFQNKHSGAFALNPLLNSTAKQQQQQQQSMPFCQGTIAATTATNTATTTPVPVLPSTPTGSGIMATAPTTKLFPSISATLRANAAQHFATALQSHQVGGMNTHTAAAGNASHLAKSSFMQHNQATVTTHGGLNNLTTTTTTTTNNTHTTTLNLIAGAIATTAEVENSLNHHNTTVPENTNPSSGANNNSNYNSTNHAADTNATQTNTPSPSKKSTEFHPQNLLNIALSRFASGYQNSAALVAAAASFNGQLASNIHLNTVGGVNPALVGMATAPGNGNLFASTVAGFPTSPMNPAAAINVNVGIAQGHHHRPSHVAIPPSS